MIGHIFLVVLLFSINAQTRGSDRFTLNFEGLLRMIYDKFKELPRMVTGRNQFAVLLMLTPDQVNNWDVQFHPHDDQGNPILMPGSDISPALENDYNNYIVATPTRHGRVHAEDRVLQHFEQLRTNFLRIHHLDRLGAIVLFTYYPPCNECTTNIISLLGPYAESVTIGVFFGSSLFGVDENDARTRIMNAKMDFGRFDNCRDVDDAKRTVEKCECVSLQEYLLCVLEQKISCCVQHSSRKSAVADFINRIMSECSSQLKNLKSCSKEAVLKLLEGACDCLNRDTTADLISNSVVESMQSTKRQGGIVHFISRPFNPTKVQSSESILSPPELKRFTPARYTCIDQRQEGVLCSSWKNEYITAGNSICKVNHPCGFHNYGYSWCYVDSNKNWEYCCDGDCGFHNNAGYRWCLSGEKWQRCGYYDHGKGLKTVKNERCRHDFPCGKHTYLYYWCRTEKSWNYCCAPGEINGKLKSCNTRDKLIHDGLKKKRFNI